MAMWLIFAMSQQYLFSNMSNMYIVCKSRDLMNIHTYRVMHVCLHMYLNEYIHIFIHTYIHKYVTACIHKYICLHIYRHTTYLHSCTHACMHAYIHSYVHIHACFAYIYACMHTYNHGCMSVHTFINVCLKHIITEFSISIILEVSDLWNYRKLQVTEIWKLEILNSGIIYFQGDMFVYR